MKLNKDEYIVTAYPESVGGPGWSNNPIWVVIKNKTTGMLSEKVIQPEEFTYEMNMLFRVSLEANNIFLDAIKDSLTKKRKKK